MGSWQLAKLIVFRLFICLIVESFKSGVGGVAGLLLRRECSEKCVTVFLQKKTCSIFGREEIDGATLDQMENAMNLPVTLQGALMPDAHVGYGLPIGGVLATKNERQLAWLDFSGDDGKEYC